MAGNFLQASRPPSGKSESGEGGLCSPCPSVIVDMPGVIENPPPRITPLLEDPRIPRNIYPSLKEISKRQNETRNRHRPHRSSDSKLDTASKAELEEEAARYEEERYADRRGWVTSSPGGQLATWDPNALCLSLTPQ